MIASEAKLSFLFERPPEQGDHELVDPEIDGEGVEDEAGGGAVDAPVRLGHQVGQQHRLQGQQGDEEQAADARHPHQPVHYGGELTTRFLGFLVTKP